PGQQVPEKMMTLDVSLRLKPLLEKAGYKVVLTRDTDVFVPLGTRVAMANSYPNAIFVCIHFNSATRSGANGIETYFYSTESAPLAPLTLIDHHAWTLVCSLSSISVSCANRAHITAATKLRPRKNPPALKKRK